MKKFVVVFGLTFCFLSDISYAAQNHKNCKDTRYFISRHACKVLLSVIVATYFYPTFRLCYDYAITRQDFKNIARDWGIGRIDLVADVDKRMIEELSIEVCKAMCAVGLGCIVGGCIDRMNKVCDETCENEHS